MKKMEITMNKDGIIDMNKIPPYVPGKWDKLLWFLPTYRKRMREMEKSFHQAEVAILTLHNKLIEVIKIMNRQYEEKNSEKEKSSKWDVHTYE